jgi:hypothetical protein
VGLIRKVFFAATLVLTSALVLTSCPDVALAGSPASAEQGAGPAESAAPKSEAAEAWDAVKNTTNPALLEAFIQRYGTTFFAELAMARLNELKAAAAKARPSAPSLHRCGRTASANASRFTKKISQTQRDGDLMVR